MIALASMVLKISAILGAGWLAASLLRNRSAAARHQAWAAAVMCSLALPPLGQVIPKWGSTGFAARAGVHRRIPSAAAPRTVALVTTQRATATRAAAPAWEAGRSVAWIWAWIWAAGAGAMLLRLATGLAQLWWAGSRARMAPAGAWFRNTALPVRLLVAQSPRAMPVTWGLFQPKILLPSNALEWPGERLRVVLEHELAHVARRDWMVRMCGELACALYWFHPLAWLAARSLREESERACDDAVLASGVNAGDYADQLVTLARTLERPVGGSAAALAMARTSNLERRLIAMLNPSIDRRRPSAGARIATAIASLCVLAALAGLRAPGQGLAGNFSGTVFDPSGAVVPGAVVTAINNAAKPPTKDTARTNAAGQFVFTNLPGGEYDVKVAAPGFDGGAVKQVTLEAGRDSTANVNLRLGRISETISISAAGTPRAPQSETPVRIRVGGNVQAARLIKRVVPAYPPNAQAGGIQGTVELEAVIGKDGSVLSLHTLSSGVDTELAAAAKGAVSQWMYSPTKLNGAPVEVITQVSVQFTLHP
jgi:TonB family protein